MRRIALLVCLLALAGIRTPAQTVNPFPASNIPWNLCQDTSGSSTAQSCSTSPSFPIIFGVAITYQTTTTNTGSLTIAVNGGAAAPVKKWLGASTLSAGDITATIPVTLTWDGSAWEVATIGNTPAGLVTSVSGTANQVLCSPTSGAVVCGFPTTIVIPNGSTATTQSPGDNTTKIATDAFVTAALPSFPMSANVLGTNGSAQPISATSSNVIALFSTCSGIQYLGADGACHSTSGALSGTTNLITKFTSSSTVGNSSMTDNGTNAVLSPNGVDVNQSGDYQWTIVNNTSTGTTLNKMICDDGTGKGIICPSASAATDAPLGSAVAGVSEAPGTTGNTGVCTLGFCQVIFDNSATATHYAQVSTSVNGDLSDVGATAPTNGQSYYYIVVGNSGAGTPATIRQMAPGELSAAQISGGNGRATQLEVNGTTTKNVANFNANTPAAGTGNLNLTWNSSNSGNTTSISAKVPISGNTSTLASAGTISGTSPACGDGSGNITNSGCPAGSAAFSSITGGTNGSAAMVVGTGASMNVSGTGTNNATSVNPTNTATSGDCVGASSSGATSVTLKDIGQCGGGIIPTGVTLLADAAYTVQAGDNAHLLAMAPTSARILTLPQPGALSSSILVNTNSAGAVTSSPATVACCTGIASGNYFVVVATGYTFSAGPVSLTTPTDGNGDSFVQLQAAQSFNSGPNITMQQWYAKTTAGTSQTISVAFSGTGANVLLQVYLLKSISSLDNATQYSATGGFPANPTIQTSLPNDFVINFLQPAGSCGSQPTNPSGFTTLFSNTVDNSQSSYAVLATQTTYTMNPTSGTTCSSNSIQQIDAFATTSTQSFANGYNFVFRNQGTAPVVLTPSSSSITSQFYTVGTSGAGIPVNPGQAADVFSDGTNWQAVIYNASINGNSSVVTVNGNVSTAQNLQAATIKANTLNKTNNSIRIWGGGYYSTEAANVSTITITCTLGGVTMASWTSAANLGGQSNDTWNVDLVLISTGTGTVGMKAHGKLAIDGITSASSDALYNDGNHATTSTFNTAADQTLQFTITFSVAGAANGNIGNQDQLVVQQVN